MRKIMFTVLSMVFCLSIAMVDAVAAPQSFSKTVSQIRESSLKNANNPKVVTDYSVKGNAATPVKVTIDMKKGESYIFNFTTAESAKGSDGFILNNLSFLSGGRKVPFTPAAYKSSGQVSYKVIGRRTKIAYNGKNLPQALHATKNSSMLFTAPRDQKFSFELMYSGKVNEAILKVIKVADTKAIDALNAQYPLDMQRMSIAGKKDVIPLIYSTIDGAEKNIAKNTIALLKNKNAFNAKLNEIDNITSVSAQIEAYLDLFLLANKVYETQQQLEWFKLSAVEMAFEALSKTKGYDVATNTKRMTELKALAGKGFNSIYDATAEGLAPVEKAMQLKKLILMDNPKFDFDKILVGRYNIGLGARNASAKLLGTPENNWSNQTSAPQSGFDAEIGVITNFKDAEVKYETLYDVPTSSSVPDLRLNYDGNRVLFGMVPAGDNHWQLHELSIKDKKVTQVTNGSPENLDFFDATYLPSGEIMTITNMGGNGVPCVNGNDQVGGLCLYNPKTKNLRRLTFDQDANWNPTIMHNGKVMYTRWEYTDLMHYYSRFVMSMNPDGTEQKALFGSGMLFPNSTFDIQPLPDHPSRFVGIVSGHHGVVRSGRLFIYDPAISRTTTDGMVHEIPYRGRKLNPIVKDKLVDGVYPQFVKPFPVDNDNFLVSAQLYKGGLWGIYLVDVYDNMTLICEYEGEGLIHATPLRTTKKQPTIPSKVDLSTNEATVFIQDIYEGEGLKGVPRGTATQLRIHTYEYAYNKSPSNHYAMGIQSGWDMKTCLGIVDVEQDGSAIFTIPANTPISIQPIDKDGAALTWMRSWLTGMPGEVVSCVGCHEDQNMIPVPKRVIASARAPRKMTVPEGGIRPFTFIREMQPILDRACISCHGEGKKLDFRAKEVQNTNYKGSGGYSPAHLNLHPYVHRQGPEAALKVLIPYEYHANVSPLVQILKNGHYGVELTDKEWRTIYQWIDYNVPDMGIFHQIRDSDLFPSQYKTRIAMGKKYANGVHHDWMKSLADYDAWAAKQPKEKAAKFKYDEPKFKDVKVKGWPAQYTKGETKTVEIAKGVSIEFVKIEGGDFVMGENRKNSNAAPAFKASVKPYWMSTTELTNAQVRALLPEHSSRCYDQQWKDHVDEGYPADGDEQVAIRIRWSDAMDYAKKASAKTGLNIQLPTEAQWEFAARGGNDADYWFATGSRYGDFGKKENFADKQTTKLAVMGVNPKPMPANHTMYKYCNYLPNDETVDDGAMLTALPGTYEANALGVHDMLGNVSEWTRTTYSLYTDKGPDKDTETDMKVVKGGHWRSHPKDARVATRVAYLPWQAPYNVGMRLVIED